VLCVGPGNFAGKLTWQLFDGTRRAACSIPPIGNCAETLPMMSVSGWTGPVYALSWDLREHQMDLNNKKRPVLERLCVPGNEAPSVSG
jgi:hypothetical protein